MILEFIKWLKNIRYTPKGHTTDLTADDFVLMENADNHYKHLKLHEELLKEQTNAQTKRSQRRGIPQKHNKTSKSRNKKTKTKSKTARKSRA